MGFTLSWVKREVERGEMPLQFKDGHKPSKEQALQKIKELETKGFECFPVCDNYDDKGNCLGHDSK